MARDKQRLPDAVTLSDEKIHARCDHVLGIMNVHFNGRDWLSADHETIAKSSCFGSISILPECDYEMDKWDKVAARLGRAFPVPSIPTAILFNGTRRV